MRPPNGLSITRGKKALPYGSPIVKTREDGTCHQRCQLGGLTKARFCTGEVVARVGNIGICKTHLNRLNKIKKASDKKHNHNGCKPQTQVFRRANAA